MSERGFEMIRARRKQFADRSEPVPDKTKPVRKPEITKTKREVEAADEPAKRKIPNKPIETQAATKENPEKRKTHQKSLESFAIPKRHQDIRNRAKKGLQREGMESLAAMRYRALKNARDTLLGLMERDVEGISNEEEMQIAELIDKQTEIVEKLRVKWNTIITNSEEEEDDSGFDSDTGDSNHELSGQEVGRTKRKRAVTRTRSSSSASTPPRKRGSNKSNRLKKYTPPPPPPSMAFPVSAPTTLPAGFRTRKDLTAEEIAEKTKVHPSFDEGTGKKIDKHGRRINCTSGKGMVAGKRSNSGEGHRRTLEEKIRPPSDSPELDLARRANSLDRLFPDSGIRK